MHPCTTMRKTYLIRINDKIVALRRFDHHPPNSPHAGAILTAQATPIIHNGTTYYSKPNYLEGHHNLPTYSCHPWHGDDATIEQITNLKIEEMR